MFDLRNYKSTIREAVKLESERDPNWNWKVVAINKSEVRIGWGYLDYIGEKKPFTITLSEHEWEDEEFDTDVFLAGLFPGLTWKDVNINEDYNFVLIDVGDERYHTAHTMEDGLKMVVHGIANHARNVF